LRPGKHQIIRNKKFERKLCGIVPLGEKCESITTKGLKYNLNNDDMSFGSLISTSNEFVDEIVQVENSHTVLWTTCLKDSI